MPTICAPRPICEQQLGGRIGIGEHITDVQKLFKELFNVERTFNTDGSQFDHLFEEGERFTSARWRATCSIRPATRRPA